jgi:hypothetical protein
MKRRSALKNMLLFGTAAWVMPSTLAKAREQSLYSRQLGFDEGTDVQLAEVVDTIIPATKTPGAKELGVHLFVLKMVKDCSNKKEQQSFLNGLKELDAFSEKSTGKIFIDGNRAQRLSILKAITNEDSPATGDLKFLASTARKLTMEGYTTSRYYMTNIVPYQLVPGHFHGCVKVDKAGKVSSKSK